MPSASVLAFVVLAGCTTSSVEVPVPARPTVTAEVVGPRALPPRTTAASNKTGVYPGFSETPRSAGVQMSADEADGMQSRLTALASARNAGKISEAEYNRRIAELRNLAENHGADAQTKIGN